MSGFKKTALLAVVALLAISAGLASGTLLGKQTVKEAEDARSEWENSDATGPVVSAETQAQLEALGYGGGGDTSEKGDGEDGVKGSSFDAPAGESTASPGDSASYDDMDDGMQPQMTVSPEMQALLETYAEGAGEGSTFAKTKDGKYSKVTFKHLGGFDYVIPERKALLALGEGEKPESQIPAPLAALNGQPVVVVGYMVPVDINADGDIRTFALTDNLMFCCFGVPPAMNEWVMVEMEGEKTVDFYDNIPVAAFGTLDMGEDILEGYVMSLYRMESTHVMDIRELLKQAETPG